MTKYFGTDGVRGRANQALTPELAFAVGRAAAAVLVQENMDASRRIIVGKDTRISGDMLEAALAAGICSVGVNVVLLGVLPTPGVAMLCRHFQTPGVVISASHNPFADNGIKFFSAAGLKLPDEVEEEIEALIDDPAPLPRAIGEEIGTIKRIDDAAALYLSFLQGAQPHDLHGYKIVVDSANGAASGLAAQLFSNLGASVHAIGDRPNGCNINADCGSTKPQALMRAVLEQGADIGVALDGDADRVIVVDEQGKILDGDCFLAICAADMLQKGKLKNNSLVVTMMSNMGLTLAMRKLGVQVAETKVGDRYVLEKMLESGANLGGEQSGHIIFSDYNTTGDGLASALYLLGVMKQTGLPLSELGGCITLLPQVLLNVPVSHKNDWQADADIRAAYDMACTALAGRGRVVLRASGTEELLRVMVEGEDQEEIVALAEAIADAIRAKRGR